MDSPVLLQDIATWVSGQWSGDGSTSISGIATLESATPHDLAFILEPQYESTPTHAGAIVTKRVLDRDIPQIIVPHPRLAMATILSKAYPESMAATFEYVDAHHPSPSYHVGPNTTIATGVSIGTNVTIGNDCRIFPGVVIYPNTIIGNRVTIHGGTIIGGDGFGFVPTSDGYVKMPHIGRVVIGNDVEIGTNVAIDRGCLGDTSIGDGTKIDNLVHIAHNCTIGRHCVIAALSGLSGGVTMGNHVTVAGQVGFQGHITIGDGVVVLAKSGVTKSISSGIISGFPAQLHKQEQRDQGALRRLIKRYLKKEIS